MPFACTGHGLRRSGKCLPHDRRRREERDRNTRGETGHAWKNAAMTEMTPLLELLGELETRLDAAGIESEVYVYDGDIVVIDMDMKCPTSDWVGVCHPKVTARTIAGEIAVERGLPADWLDQWCPAIDRDALPLELGRLMVEVADSSEVLALLLAVPEPVRNAAEILKVMRHAGISDAQSAAELALEGSDGFGERLDIEEVLADLRGILG